MHVEFCVELEDRADRLDIPWASPDETSNRYYDLKAQPELLDEIAEARANPALKQFLLTLNAPDTMFATAKCHTWSTQEFSAAERSSHPASSAKFASYVDVVFSHPAFNFQREHYEQLARRISPRLSSNPAPARAELCLRHCYYHAQQAWGYYLTIFLYGYGSDAAAAERNWAAALGALGDTLVHLSRLLRQALQQLPSAPTGA